MFTCIGADPRDFILEACTFMKQKDPKLEAGLEISSCATWVDGGDMARLSDGIMKKHRGRSFQPCCYPLSTFAD